MEEADPGPTPGQPRADAVSEVGLVPGGIVHVLQDPPDDPLQLLPRPLLLLQRLAHPLVVLLWEKHGSMIGQSHVMTDQVTFKHTETNRKLTAPEGGHFKSVSGQAGK